MMKKYFLFNLSGIEAGVQCAIEKYGKNFLASLLAFSLTKTYF